MRTFVIGDIHGAAKALQQVLDKASFDYDDDKLIVLGDICDGWSQIKESIDILLRVKNLILLKGNHDAWYLQALLEKQHNIPFAEKSSWLYHGGNATIESIGFNYDIYSQFLNKGELLYIDENNNLFVHAGVWGYDICTVKHFLTKYQGMGIDFNLRQKSNIEFLFLWDRRDLDDFMISPYVIEDFNHVYIGHTPILSYEKYENHFSPLTINNLTLMDSGAAFHGTLSMLNIDTKEEFVSDVVRESFYPTEKGRNHKSFSQQ
jgi:serine/threonine protein phosphatase 1